MSNVRVGIVGTGTIASMCHAPGYEAHPDADIVAVADVDLERARRMAERLGPDVAAYASAKEMYEDAKPDAVSVCTFNASHVPLAIEAIRHGVDVLLEKPMATNESDAAALVAELERHPERIVMIGMSHRYRNDARQLHHAVATGALGDVYFAKVRILRRRGVPQGWFTSAQYAGGGPMMDIGVHALDLAWWLMGRPAPKRVMGKMFRKVAPYVDTGADAYRASSSVNQQDRVYDVEDMGAGFITFENGAALTVEASWAMNGPQDDSIRLELFGTRGGASLDPLVLYTDEEGVAAEHRISVPSANYYHEEIKHFIECVRSRAQPRSDARQGYEVVRMLDAIKASSDEEDVVKL